MTEPTPTARNIPLRHGDFPTLTEALDYAATGDTGFNYFDGKGRLVTSLSYADLRTQSIDMAKRLVGFAPKDSRIGLAAVSTPDFAILFFACQYAGLVPAPLPLPVTLGGRSSYERQLERMADTGDFFALFAPASMEPIMSSALNDTATPVLTFDDVNALPAGDDLRPFGADDLCYIQYSSGSTSSPKGILGTQSSVSANCHGITKYGLQVNETDRATSWLPLYHDMGLIGCMIAPMMAQLSVDFMDPTDFTRRPMTWLQLISDNKGTLSYSPTFGYELCVRRWRGDRELDLSSWRAAGIGGDMVRPEPLTEFSELFGPMGFEESAFTPSYGMAETTLAATFAPRGQGLLKHTIDMRRYEMTSTAVTATDLTPAEDTRTFVACGVRLPDHEVEIRDADNKVLGEDHVGRICLKGPSLSPGYFRNSQATEAAFSKDGWLDTGDLGYWHDGQLIVTGRYKDLILYHGRNIWPQDIEWAAQAAAPHRCGRACAFSVGGAGDQKTIMLLLECRTRDPRLLTEIETAVSAAIRLEVGVPVQLMLVPKSTMIITSSGKLSRARVKQKYLDGGIIDLQAATQLRAVQA
ncbi:acyl-CoA synthetase [Algimonas ampicilliniresistens]|uniref:Acyl-CoA synthetase n=1 Tax=Algimonas ampicilliniresistens TaxID=1298735 RepID=A0ABQ5V7Z7_9PROT|nr:fatty acyl-AMP ligase [Algimonas ampicilliniresistens]GLQ23671.1 acyl-CoA synthetase [Algimonas ampicilliniresistens]